MTPAYTPRRSRTPFTKLSGHGQCEGHQVAENVLEILQEVEKRLREELAAVEEISWRLQPIIRTPPSSRSKFTWRSDVDHGLKNGFQLRTQSKLNQNECGDSLHIGSWTRTSSSTRESILVSESKLFDGDRPLVTSRQKPCTRLEPVSYTATGTCSADDVRGPLCRREQEPFASPSRELVRSERVPSQGHPDSLNSRGVSSEGCLAHHTNDTAWMLDAMQILREYYLKRARLRLEAEQPLENALPASAFAVSTSCNSAEKATQTSPVICEQIHTSPCGHFQWTASDRITPDVIFFISPFDSDDNRKTFLSNRN